MFSSHRAMLSPIFYLVADGTVNLEVVHYPNPAYKERTAKDADQDGEKKEVVAQQLLAPSAGAAPANSSKSVLTVKREGDHFGMRGLAGEGMLCSATASSRVKLLVLSKPNWDRYLTTNAALQNRILACLGTGMELQLQGLAFLKDIQLDKLKLMAMSFRFVTLEKDQKLFTRGDLGKEGNGLHLLVEGEVKVLILDENEEKTVAVVKPRQFFGEVGMVVHLPRTATVVTRKKSLFLELSQADFRRFTQIAPEVLEAFKDKLEDYNIPLRYLIHNPVLQRRLVQFMESEKSAENIRFWMKAKNFRLSDNKEPDAARDEAQVICDDHIKDGADTQVNLLGTTQKEIVNMLKNPSTPIGRDLLQKAEEEVLLLMGRDTFGRFKVSPNFHQCLREMTVGNNYQDSEAASKAAGTRNVEGTAPAKRVVHEDPGF